MSRLSVGIQDKAKDRQPHLDWYKTDGRLTLDVAIWVAFQYACVAFSQRRHPELDFTPEGYQRVVWAFENIKHQLLPSHGFIDVGMPELTLLGNYEGLCGFREYVKAVFGYELQVADELHPDYRYMVSDFSDGDSVVRIAFYRRIPSTRCTLCLSRLHIADLVGTPHHSVFTRGTAESAEPV